MDNNDTVSSGRYAWAAILIILAVVLAAIAFITWIVNMGSNNDVNQVESTPLYNTTSYRSDNTGVPLDKTYDRNTTTHTNYGNSDKILNNNAA